MTLFFKTTNSSFLVKDSVNVDPSQILNQTLKEYNTVDFTFMPQRTIVQQKTLRTQIEELLSNVSSSEKEDFINTILCSLDLTKESQIIIIAASYNIKLTPVLIKAILEVVHNAESIE